MDGRAGDFPQRLFARAAELAAADWPHEKSHEWLRLAAEAALRGAFNELLPALILDPEELARAWRPLHEPQLLDALARLREREPERAAAVRDRLFLFADIAGLADCAVRRVLRKMKFATLVCAMLIPEPEAERRILCNVSPRAREMIRQDKAFLGPMRMVDVYAARHAVLTAMYELADAGALPRARADDETAMDKIAGG